MQVNHSKAAIVTPAREEKVAQKPPKDLCARCVPFRETYHPKRSRQFSHQPQIQPNIESE